MVDVNDGLDCCDFFLVEMQHIHIDMIVQSITFVDLLLK